MPRIRKNTEYPLVFLTNYNAEDVLVGDRCKFISSHRFQGELFVKVELEINRSRTSIYKTRECFHWRLGGIEKYLEGVCQG